MRRTLRDASHLSPRGKACHRARHMKTDGYTDATPVQIQALDVPSDPIQVHQRAVASFYAQLIRSSDQI